MLGTRRCVRVAFVTPLCSARRTVHHANDTTNSRAEAASCTAASSLPSPSPQPPSHHDSARDRHAPPPSDALQPDDTEGWMLAQMQRSVESGRQTQAAADYFRGILHDQPEFHQCLQEARRLMGGQEPERLTRYQQGQFADRLCNYVSGIASEKMRRAHAEEANTKRYTQDGTPTGEHYWFEAGTTLSSPDVPTFVKDEILHDMQKERSAKSPAFEHPPEEAELASEDDGYATHLRRQRSKLLSDADFK